MTSSKRLKIISATKKDVAKMKGARDYIGKDVISKSGDKIGKVHDVLFTGSVVDGILISKTISSLFIDRKFIESASGKSIMLSIDPVTMMLGKQVFDSDGKKMGKVVKVVRKGNTNQYDSVVVKKNFYIKPVKVPKADITTSKKNLILKKVY